MPKAKPQDKAKSKKPEELTEREKKFIAEYVVNRNATRAAIRAGYSPDSAAFIGSENLKKPYIKKIVDKYIQAEAEAYKIDASRVSREWAFLLEIDPSEYLYKDNKGRWQYKDFDDLTPEQKKGIKTFYVTKGGKLRYTLYQREDCLDKVARHFGMYDDSLKVKGLEGLEERLNAGLKRVAERRKRLKDGEKSNIIPMKLVEKEKDIIDQIEEYLEAADDIDITLSVSGRKIRGIYIEVPGSFGDEN